MIINNARYLLAFSGLDLDNVPVRRAIEDALPEYSFTMLALRDVPVEVPRMIGTSQDGALQIHISNARLDMRFLLGQSGEDIGPVFSKLEECIMPVKNAIKSNKIALGMSGIMIRYSYPELDATEHLQKNIFRWDLSDDLCDIGAHFSMVKNKRYFINVSLEKINMLQKNPLDGKLSVLVDINNLYAEREHNMPSDICPEREILDLHRMIAQRKLHQLIAEGRFVCDDE